MKKIKRISALLLVIAMFISCISMSASASTHSRHVNDSTRFSDEWEHTRIYIYTADDDDERYIGSLSYGYDKGVLSNKDYAWTEGDECKTRAGIKRVGIDGSVKYGDWLAVDEYSKISVSHESFELYYYIQFANDYSNKLTGYTNHNTKVNV